MTQEGLNHSRFAEEIGIQRAAMSHITSGRNNPSMDVVMRILERFDHINPDWLIFGKGNMKRENHPTHLPKQPDLFANPPYIPAEKKNIPEERREIKDKKPQITPKKAENETVITKETPVKKTVKIMLFYSDNTYETFNPEKL
jgi:transcriptional regulator with XRE-family HTH domain